MIEWIGFIAAVLTTGCYVPQAWHIIRTRNTGGISLLGYSLLTVGVFCWLVYGFCKGDLPITFANGITFSLLVIILTMKIRLG